MSLRKLIWGGVLASAAAVVASCITAADDADPTGTWAVESMNGEPLPFVTAQTSSVWWVEHDTLIIAAGGSCEERVRHGYRSSMAPPPGVIVDEVRPCHWDAAGRVVTFSELYAAGTGTSEYRSRDSLVIEVVTGQGMHQQWTFLRVP